MQDAVRVSCRFVHSSHYRRNKCAAERARPCRAAPRQARGLLFRIGKFMARRELAQLLDSAGALNAILRARAGYRWPWLTVLTYHRIHPDPQGQPFDQGVIDATPSEFEQQVATLRRYFTIVGLEELSRHMQGGPLPPNPAVLTFDDGYRDCYDRVLPILLRQGVKAAFFIATMYVEQRRVFWWDRINYVINRSGQEQLEIRYPIHGVIQLRDRKEQATAELLRIAKRWYHLDIDRFLDELTQAARVDWSPELERKYADELVMSWDQVRALRRAGMEIHSHTRTHRVLQTVPHDELVSELAGSKHDLEEQLGERVSSVSYPVGRPIAQDPAIRSMVAQAGYGLGFSNMNGVTWTWGRFDPLDVQRLRMGTDVPNAYFRGFLAVPWLAHANS
jgi:peptidoglycan/xylan/chitin deacetylase (PgdA/CDA1 family)